MAHRNGFGSGKMSVCGRAMFCIRVKFWCKSGDESFSTLSEPTVSPSHFTSALVWQYFSERVIARMR